MTITTNKEVISNFRSIMLNEGNKEGPVKYTDPKPIKEVSDGAFQYMLTLLAATPVTAWAGFIWAKSVLAGTSFLKELKAAPSTEEKKKVISKYFSKEALNYVLDPTNLFKYVEGVPDVKVSKDQSLDEVLDALIAGGGEQPEQEEGTSLSLAQLEDICKNVEFIKSQIGEGDVVPDWALQHISVAADNIHEVVVFFEGEEQEESPEEQSAEDIHMIGEGGKKKPSEGLSKKQKSAIVKKAEKGEDIGKKGKGFEKVAAKAGGGEKGTKIAAAAMWKQQAKKAK